jgi:serine/threonine protein kinase
MSVNSGPSHVLLPMVPNVGPFNMLSQRPNLLPKRISAPARFHLSPDQTLPPSPPSKHNSWLTAARPADAERPIVPIHQRTMADVSMSVEKSVSRRQDSALQLSTSPPSMNVFAADQFDYELLPDKKLGSGRWSIVYLATSVLASVNRPGPSIGMITPPTTPTRPQRSNSLPESRPEYYAIKVAANRSSVEALKEEATILSHLSSFFEYERHIVPFHGYDTRNNSIVFSALPSSLEDLIGNELSRFDEPSRVAELSSIFPRLAKSMISSLAWIHDANVIHADIKPANILLRPAVPTETHTPILGVPFTSVLADFTSSFRTDISSVSSTASAMGGGTYDFLSPELLLRPFPPPSAASDVYALAITLLHVIIGASPYATARGNRFQLLEMAKTGQAIDFAMQDPRSEARLRNTADIIQRSTGIDVIKALSLALQKNSDVRISARAWCAMF